VLGLVYHIKKVK